MKNKNESVLLISFFEWMNWIKIFISPTLLFGVIGFIIKLYFNSTMGNILFWILMIIGIIVGIVWANKVKRKHGTTHYMSRNDASSDLD